MGGPCRVTCVGRICRSLASRAVGTDTAGRFPEVLGQLSISNHTQDSLRKPSQWNHPLAGLPDISALPSAKTRLLPSCFSDFQRRVRRRMISLPGGKYDSER
jgi:hypothetical protein